MTYHALGNSRKYRECVNAPFARLYVFRNRSGRLQIGWISAVHKRYFHIVGSKAGHTTYQSAEQELEELKSQ